MTHRNAVQPSNEELLSELNACKAKLNEQKVLIEQLRAAVTRWRQQAFPKPIATLKRTWVAPLIPEDRRGSAGIKMSTRRTLLAEAAEDLKAPGMYFIRLTEETVPATGLTPYDEYRLTIYGWEKPDGTTDNNT